MANTTDTCPFMLAAPSKPLPTRLCISMPQFCRKATIAVVIVSALVEETVLNLRNSLHTSN